MKRIMALVVATTAASLLMAPGAMALSPGCFVAAGGTVDGDSFGGEAASRPDGSIKGTWTHIAEEGTFIGTIDLLFCQRNGGEPEHPAVDFSIANATGTGTWNGEPGYLVDLRLQDHGEPGRGHDIYRIVITDSDDTIVYVSAGIIDSGNIQLVSTNPGHP